MSEACWFRGVDGEGNPNCRYAAGHDGICSDEQAVRISADALERCRDLLAEWEAAAYRTVTGSPGWNCGYEQRRAEDAAELRRALKRVLPPTEEHS